MPVREQQQAGSGHFDEARDATRRTRLANERTYLAWWRTGLTAFAVSIGSGKLVPALTTGATWPYTAIGIGFAIVGVFCVGYAFWRYREVEEAVRRLLLRTSASSRCSPASAPRWEFCWSSCSWPRADRSRGPGVAGRYQRLPNSTTQSGPHGDELS
jgi:uncharacterized membrane protein YidH (DUF202 family)